MVVVDCGRGGGVAKLWVLIMVVVEWVDKREREDEGDLTATLRGVKIFFFGCGFYLILAC